MLFNDRRKAKKAASATTKAQIAAMAKAGTLRAETTSPGQRKFGQAERSAVKSEASNMAAYRNEYPNKNDYAAAAKKVSKAEDVKGFGGTAYRKMAADNNKSGQNRKWLPKKGK
mgnify:CR=1 FL=1